MTTRAILLTSSALLVLTACTSDTMAPVDHTPPAVVSKTPAAGATGVSPVTPIAATFSEPLATSSVTNASVFVAGSTAVAGSVGLSGATVTFSPTAPLPAGADYTVTITTAVTDAAGNTLAQPVTWSFRTNVPPAANAGANQDVNPGGTVTLTGTATDPDGQTLTYTWTQISGQPVTALTGPAPSFTAPDTVGTLAFQLVVSDGVGTSPPAAVVVSVLEDKAHALFVSPVGNDANPGTRAAPFATIHAAIDAAVAGAQGADVYVAGGLYSGSLSLGRGTSVYGGFNATSWLRDVQANPTAIAGGPVAISGVRADSLTLDGLTISSDAAITSGASSIGIALDSSRGVVVSRNTITAGAGATGATGTTPAASASGGNGADGTIVIITCEGLGAGGTGNGYAGGDGGSGSHGNGNAGVNGSGPRGGAGGVGGSGVLLAIQGGDGFSGGDGGTGATGSGAAAIGTIGHLYVGAIGGTAGTGVAGSGGGGGGSGRGAVLYCSGSGGGGGAGGSGGAGGLGGHGGGASFGILLAHSSAVIRANAITTGFGGTGGAGGDGGFGGSGGTPGAGFDAGLPAGIGAGGAGGRGGRGGSGGTGGGGGGGPSIGIAEDSASVTNLSAGQAGGNVFALGLGGGGGGPTAGLGATGMVAPWYKK